jgi:hypothetical protein
MTTDIFECVAGSKLFGTATETSDTDFKAVHVPTARSILLGTANAVIDQSTGDSHSTNSAEDVDLLSIPLQRYLKMLAKMEVNAIEMLFAPNFHVDDFMWQEIKANRFKVMNLNMKAFTGYAKGQAMRYAVRGDRLDTLIAVVERLKKMDPKVPISKQMGGTGSMWLADMPNVRVWDKPQPGDRMIPHMSVFGREVSLTLKPLEAIKVYQKPIDEAGARSIKATSDGGPDWKGLYHAQRIVDEGLELFTTGELRFPCANASYYVDIRSGSVELDTVLNAFEESLARLEAITPIPEFQEKADQEWIDNFVLKAYEDAVIYDWSVRAFDL